MTYVEVGAAWKGNLLAKLFTRVRLEVCMDVFSLDRVAAKEFNLNYHTGLPYRSLISVPEQPPSGSPC